MNVRIAWCLLLLLPVFAARSQEASYRLLSFNQGLTTNQVTAVLRDRFGLTWIGTLQGLNCYDGRTVANFRNTERNTLPSDEISSLEEDAAGNIWVGTSTGIHVFDNPFHREITQRFHLPAALLTTYAKVKRLSNGRLYLWNNQMICRQTASGWKQIALPPAVQQAGITTIELDGNEQLYAGTFRGLYCCVNGKWKAVPFFTENDYLVNCLYYHTNGTLLVGTWGHGLFARKSTDHWVNYLSEPQTKGMGTDNIVFSIFPANDAANSVLVSCSEGVFASAGTAADLSANSWRCRKNDLSETFGIAATDREHNLFVATGSGIRCYLQRLEWLEQWSMEPAPGAVTSLRLRDGSLFATSWYGKGAFEITSDRKTHLIGTIPTPLKKDAEQISGSSFDREGRLWLASLAGIGCYDPKLQRYVAIPYPEIPATERTNAVCWDARGRLWIGFYANGIGCYDPATRTYTAYSPTNGNFPNRVWLIRQASDGTIVIGTDNGILLYANGQWRSKAAEMGSVFGMAEDRRHTLWFAGANGLFSLDKQRKTVHAFGLKDGLPELALDDLCLDDHDRAWIISPQFLTCFDTRTHRVHTFSTVNRVPEGIAFRVVTPGTDGFLYIASTNGIQRFQPKRLLQQRSIFPLIICNISVNTVPQFPLANSRRKWTLQLDHFQNRIEVDFVLPGLFTEASYFYRYRLNGESWKAIGHQNSILFSSLKPGDYVLEIECSTNQSDWQPAAQSLRFLIASPIWKQWWFVLLAVLLFACIVIGLMVLFYRRKLVEKQLKLDQLSAIERERSRISRDMHDDLGSGLTTISILSEVVKRQLTTETPAGPYLDQIAESAGNLVDNLNQIVWSLHSGNDHLPSLAAYIREYLSRYLEPTNIALRVHYPETIPDWEISEEQRRNSFLILKEAIHNAVKYGQGAPITLELDIRERTITFRLSDAGPGFDRTQIRSGANGLKNMQKRAEVIHAQLTISSEPDSGTSLSLTISLNP